MGDAVSAPRHTPGPWERRSREAFGDDETAVEPTSPNVNDGRVIALCYGVDREANASLIAAAPELYDGCNALLGLIQLLLGRDDLTAELREVLTTNHRIDEAQAAVAKAVQQ